jgi:hypothetical protein
VSTGAWVALRCLSCDWRPVLLACLTDRQSVPEQLFLSASPQPPLVSSRVLFSVLYPRLTSSSVFFFLPLARFTLVQPKLLVGRMRRKRSSGSVTFVRRSSMCE